MLSSLVAAVLDPSPGQTLLQTARLMAVPALAALAADCEVRILLNGG